jgi:hypothetical protein
VVELDKNATLSAYNIFEKSFLAHKNGIISACQLWFWKLDGNKSKKRFRSDNHFTGVMNTNQR